MYQALIVDDEAITRKGLISHIDWNKFNIEEVFTAANAREAIELLEDNKIDIIISDVRMPGMNGIEMCREIKRISEESQIIFLSGFSDKEYLKGAIELSAVSYVEKPINIQEVENAIDKAVKRLDRNINIENTVKQAISQSKAVMEESRDMLSKEFLQRLIREKLSVASIKEYAAKLDVDLLSMNRFNIFLFKCNMEDTYPYELAKVLCEKMGDISYIYEIQDYGHIVFLVGYLEEHSSKLDILYRNIADFVKNNKEYRLNASLGKRVPNIMNVSLSYDTAKQMMDRLFVKGYGYTNSHVESEDEPGKLNIDEKVYEQFSEALTKFDENSAREIAEKIKSEIFACSSVSVSYVKAVYFRLVEAALKAADITKNIEDEKNDAEQVSFIMETLAEQDTLDSCHAYVSELLKEYFDNSREFANNSRTIINIIEYIKSNYSNPDLCLDEIADYVFITPNYMNSLFKKKFGTTIGQYITKVRINAAKEFLKNKNVKLSDVAGMVGYNDPGYFAKAFRKNVGVSPKTYLNQQLTSKK